MSAYRLNSLLAALGFVTSGVVLLLFTLDALGSYQRLAQLILAVLLAGGGIGFFVAYFVTHTNWWQLIPAWTLLSLSVMVYASLPAATPGTRSAALLFGGLALAFAHVYLLNRREYWWAIMPGGFMLVLSLVILLSELIQPLNVLGAILFIGMGLVFGLIYLLGDRYQQWWAVLPGIILLTFGLFLLLSTAAGPNQFARWWPLVLILAGLWVGWRGTNSAGREKLEVHTVTRRPRTAALSTNSPVADPGNAGRLGDYTRPAPGASVEVLPDPDDG